MRELDPDRQLFGALNHDYALNPVLSEAELVAFEARHHVALPVEYRAFLAGMGNGGAGPYCGISPLASWRPELVLVTRTVAFDGDVPLVADGKPVLVDAGPRPEIERLAEPSRPFLLEGPWPRRGESELPGPHAHPLDGCLHLTEMGDGYRCFLVVTGERAGEVWEDHTVGVAFEAIRPTSLGFIDWYALWLEAAQAECLQAASGVAESEVIE